MAGEVVAAAAAMGKKVKGGKAGAARKIRKSGRTWVWQDVPAGAYGKAFVKAADGAVPEIEKVVGDVMRELQ